MANWFRRVFGWRLALIIKDIEGTNDIVTPEAKAAIRKIPKGGLALLRNEIDAALKESP